jgi:biotin synthase
MNDQLEIRDLIALAIVNPDALSQSDWASLLRLEDPEDVAILTDAAYAVKAQEVGAVIRVRGLIEFSNLCVKNCHYCGIRCANQAADRYQLDIDEIVVGAQAARANGYASLVLQAGERRDEAFTHFVAKALTRIHEATDGELGITLSLGEQSARTYRLWREAGAHRYLLRIETTNRDLYAALHPSDHDWDERLRSIERLRETGYMVGTGVLIGLPGQTVDDLAADLLFFRNRDVDMISMGPFIPHDGTPLAGAGFDSAAQLDLGLKMISCARLLLRDVNIASTTALEALAPDGRARGLLAGGNVILSNHTAAGYPRGYQLYRGKPALDESGGANRQKLLDLAASIGEGVGFGEWGDAPHYHRRQAAVT